MPKELSSSPRFQYEPLTRDDLRKIHANSMQIFSEVGFEVMEPQAFELFKNYGARTDAESHKVFLTEKQVMDIISSVPPRVTLYGRDDRHNCVLGAGNVYYATGGTALNMLDYENNKRRPAQLQDLADVVRLVDKLDNIHVLLLPTYPNELPVDDVDINRFFTGLCYTDKHIMGGVYTAWGIEKVISMAEEIAGGQKALRERPFISMITCGISPLKLDSKYGAYMIQLAKHGIPTAVPVEPLCGATAPITLAGTLVIQNCDGLIHMMLTQLANAGAPAIYGSVATSVDLHDVSYLGGPVESGMINAAAAQLARYYSFPYYSTAGISDTKTLDTQCGYETAVNDLLVGLAGGDLIHDAAGLMEFALTVSKEKLVMDNDILGMAMRAVKGITVNDKTLAYNIIKSEGPGGNFVRERHTRRYMKKEHYKPTIADRYRRDQWEDRGHLTTAQRAHNKVNEILSASPRCYLDSTIARRIIKEFPEIKNNLFPV